MNEIIEDANKNKYTTLSQIQKRHMTVDRYILWKILEKIGLTKHMRKIINSMCRYTIATYNCNGIEIGVKM